MSKRFLNVNPHVVLIGTFFLKTVITVIFALKTNITVDLTNITVNVFL